MSTEIPLFNQMQTSLEVQSGMVILSEGHSSLIVGLAGTSMDAGLCVSGLSKGADHFKIFLPQYYQL
jgi:hypothetical protein